MKQKTKAEIMQEIEKIKSTIAVLQLSIAAKENEIRGVK